METHFTSFRSSDSHSNALFMSKSKDSAPFEPGSNASFTKVFAAISITETSFDGNKLRKLLE